jgi:hypothetical protein
MRTSPTFMGLLYFSLGSLFTYLAIQSGEDNVWSFTTIILMMLATFDFAVSIRFFLLKKKIERIKKSS